MSGVSLHEAFAPSARMVGREIAGEQLLVPLVGRGGDLDSIFHLNGLGAFVWQHLDGVRPGTDIVRAIVDRYEVDPERAAEDYCRFLEQLVSINAVTGTQREN